MLKRKTDISHLKNGRIPSFSLFKLNKNQTCNTYPDPHGQLKQSRHTAHPEINQKRVKLETAIFFRQIRSIQIYEPPIHQTYTEQRWFCHHPKISGCFPNHFSFILLLCPLLWNWALCGYSVYLHPIRDSQICPAYIHICGDDADIRRVLDIKFGSTSILEQQKSTSANADINQVSADLQGSRNSLPHRRWALFGTWVYFFCKFLKDIYRSPHHLELAPAGLCILTLHLWTH